MTEQEQVQLQLWEQLGEIVDSGNAEHLAAFLQLLAPEDTAYTISRLDEDHQTRMWRLLSSVRPEFAADLMAHFTDEYAADMIEQLDPEEAASIVDEMDSDEQADVLAELDVDDAAAILDQMDPQEAEDARERLQYPEDSAGGLMITEYLAYREGQDVDAVIQDLRKRAAENEELEVRYLYVLNADERLTGVLTMRALLLAPRGRSLTDLMVRSLQTVTPNVEVDALEDLFDRYDFSAVPVVDAQGRLLGVVQRAAVQEALSERSNEDLMKFGGIIGGEELRSMPVFSRSVRRLAFLCPNIALSVISISIIAVYEPLIKQFSALAVFLPLVANLSGASGNQSVAVSIRELSLGLVRSGDVMRVLRRELFLGLLNGLVIGVALGVIAMVMRHQTPGLAAVVAVAFALNNVIAVCLGASLPLVLKWLRVDPAMVSSPVLTTVTDMGSFFLVLSLASVVLQTTGVA